MIKFSPGRSRNYLHIWINIISTFPCYTDVSILKAYWNLQNLQEMSLNIQLQQLIQTWTSWLSSKPDLWQVYKKLKKYSLILKFQTPGAGVAEVIPMPLVTVKMWVDNSWTDIPLIWTSQIEEGGAVFSDIANYSSVNASVRFNTYMTVVCIGVKKQVVLRW